VRIVHVERRLCILSTGEELLIRFEKLRTLCEQLQQEQCRGDGADVANERRRVDDLIEIASRDESAPSGTGETMMASSELHDNYLHDLQVH
jgi:hypothetical protein